MDKKKNENFFLKLIKIKKEIHDCYSAEENKKCNNSFHSSLIICDI